LLGSQQRRAPHKPVRTEKLTFEEPEISDLRRALNLPDEILLQAQDLFQMHAKPAPMARGLFKDRRLTEAGFAKVWFEMTGQEGEAEDAIALQILAEAFMHAGDSRELDFAQFATWFSSRCFCEDVSQCRHVQHLVGRRPRRRLAR